MKRQHIDIAKWVGIVLVVGGILWKCAVWTGEVNTKLEAIEKKLDRLDPAYGPPSR